MVVETTAAIIVGTILLLPWTLKMAGLWEKVKRWYNYLVMGLLFGLIAGTLSLFATTSFLSIFKESEIFWMVEFLAEVVGVILLVVGALGISKQLFV
jgi:hypothetical protein